MPEARLAWVEQEHAVQQQEALLVALRVLVQQLAQALRAPECLAAGGGLFRPPRQ